MSHPFVLASTSRHRADLLGRLGVPFTCVAPTFDERAYDNEFSLLGPARFATRLALGKCESVRAHHPDAFVLGADQIAVLDDHLLHKPITVLRAVEQLLQLSGKTHELLTAVVLVGPDDTQLEFVDRHRLTMRSFGESEARAYVTAHRPVECVGSYRIEDAGIALFAHIEGSDPTAIEGLPLLRVAEFMRITGLLPWRDAKPGT